MHVHNIDHTVAKLRRLPPERIAEVEDFIDFLHQRAQLRQAATQKHGALDFPVDHAGGQWPSDLSLRREDMYGDDGR